MKLAKYYLNQVANADHLQTIVGVVFFIIFTIIIAWVILGPKKMYIENGNMPLEDNDMKENYDNNSKIE